MLPPSTQIKTIEVGFIEDNEGILSTFNVYTLPGFVGENTCPHEVLKRVE